MKRKNFRQRIKNELNCSQQKYKIKPFSEIPQSYLQFMKNIMEYYIKLKRATGAIEKVWEEILKDSQLKHPTGFHFEKGHFEEIHKKLFQDHIVDDKNI